MHNDSPFANQRVKVHVIFDMQNIFQYNLPLFLLKYANPTTIYTKDAKIRYFDQYNS